MCNVLLTGLWGNEMTWHAKPSGGYSISSNEGKDNIDAISGMLYNTWTLEAIAGMLGNMVSESGLNPWRWQSDSVSLTSDKKGYGLAQFTPAKGYIYDYGVGVTGYSPNLSTRQITQGATPEDGYAQIIVIDQDRAHKYIDRSSKCNYANISAYPTIGDYKGCNDLWLATVAWLFNYEYPSAENRTYQKALDRYANANAIYQYISGVTPTPTPTPPTPPMPPPFKSPDQMPIWMYPMFRRYK